MSSEKSIPKGGMCMSCTQADKDCSGKDFSSMQPIKIYPDGVKAVKCVDFERAKVTEMTEAEAMQFLEGKSFYPVIDPDAPPVDWSTMPTSIQCTVTFIGDKGKDGDS